MGNHVDKQIKCDGGLCGFSNHSLCSLVDLRAS